METTPRLSSEVLWREVDGEIVVLDVRRGRYYGIQGVGVDIWKASGSNKNRRRILEDLEREYDADGARLQADMAAFFERLEKAGLLKS